MTVVSHYELLQLPIVSLDTARILGQVDEIIFDGENARVAGFVTGMGVYEAKVLRFSAVQALGPDAIMVADDGPIRPIGGERDLDQLAGADLALSGAAVLTEAGEAVGVVGSLYIDRQTGGLAGFQLVPPIEIDTVPEGLLPMSAVLRLGDSLILVQAGYRTQLVQGEDDLSVVSAASAPPAASAAGPTAKRKSPARPKKEAASRTKRAAPADDAPVEHSPMAAEQQDTPQPPEQVVEPDPPAQDDASDRHFLIGKKVLRQIEAPGGEVIAEEGEAVTPEMIRRARASDQLLILSLNVD